MRGRNTGTDPGTGVAGFPGVLRVLALLLTLPLTLGLTGPAAAETRVALVIGINAYQNAPVLATPVNDAQAIGDALRRSNFEVEELHDPDFRTLTRSIREFGIRAAKAETALVYYAGHGVQVDHENYLIPVDARLERARDVTYEAVPLSLVLGETAQASRIGIVLLDSCRDNPFIGRVAQPASGQAVAATPGLARVDNVPRNSMVVMAAKADKVADDGIEHSPFAAAVLAHLQIPGLELGLFFRAVRDAVLKATQNRQEPYVFSSLGAEPFYFYPRPPNRPPLIGPIPTLRVAATAGPTPLGILAPTDPDLDLLSVRIVGLPRNGEVRVEGRKATLGQAFSADRFMTGTFKPDGTGFGPSGTLDLLVEDGRGGSAIGNLPIVVVPPGLPSSGAQVPGAPSAVAQAPVAQVPAAQAPAAQAPVTPSPTAQALLPFGPPSGPGPGAAKPAVATAAAPASPTPSLPALSNLAEARTLALGVPCALIDIQEAPSPGQSGRLLVAGPALPGAAFDS
ncbi:MAG: caspase domain-containing protein, partial [Rhodopila sp.]